ncbi:ABC transporter permease, partial [Streptomyces puniciscabiei]
NNWWIALAWSLGLAALGYRWSTAKFNQDTK